MEEEGVVGRDFVNFVFDDDGRSVEDAGFMRTEEFKLGAETDAGSPSTTDIRSLSSPFGRPSTSKANVFVAGDGGTIVNL